MRIHVLSVAIGVLAIAGPAFGQGFGAYLQARYPDPARVTVQRALAEAIEAGWIGNSADRLAFKNEFYALRERKGDAAIAVDFLRDFPLAGAVVHVADSTVVETEFNDSIGYADSYGAGNCVSGNSVNDDADFYSFVSTGEYITAEVVGTGAAPITDSVLGLRTAQGHLVAFGDDISGTNLNSRVSTYLPPGTFYLEVGSLAGFGGDYDVLLTRDPVNLMTLTAAGPNAGTTASFGTGTQDVFSFTLAAPARVDSTVAGNGADPALTVQLADGRVWFANDDSERFGLDPSMDLILPAGTYYAHVTDVAGGSIPYTINHSETATTITELCSAGSGTGLINGRETRDLYLLLVGMDQTVDLVTSAGPTSPVGDTILYLFDADMNYLADVDDYQVSDLYSRIATGLPTGSYYVGVRGWFDHSGDYTVTATCNQPFPATGVATYGRNSLNAAGGGQVDLATLEVCTDTCLRLDSTTSAASAFYGLMDANGMSLGASEWTIIGSRAGPSGRHRDRHTAVEVPPGTHYVLTWYRYDGAFPVTVDIRPPLECDLTGNLVSHGKAGDTAFLFADFFTGPGMNFGVGDNGLFCLAFPSATLTTIGLGVVPASGRLIWGACPTLGFSVYIQQGDLHTSPAWPSSPGLGTWRNRNVLQ